MNLLFDWRQWFFAVITGLISALAYAFLTDYLKRRRWRGHRKTVIQALHIEILWIYFATRHWPWGDDFGDQRVFEARASRLREIMSRGGPVGMQVPWAELTANERTIVRDGLPSLVPLARDLVTLIERNLQFTGWLWRDRELEIINQTLNAVRQLSDWDPPSQITPAQEGWEIFRGLDIAIKALEGIDRLQTEVVFADSETWWKRLFSICDKLRLRDMRTRP